MNMLMSLLAWLPKNSAAPGVAALAAWYIGAKYGAPDMYINAIDGALAAGADFLGSLANGGGDGATTGDG